MSTAASPAELKEKIKNDRILNTYQVLGTDYICYDASGFFSPIAIRDQIIRVCLIIERAAFHKIISADRPLLVIGGGIAGVTAAFKAYKMGIPVVLVEGRKTFNVFRESVRYFCPIQYDWSVPHWDLGVFPWSGGESISIPVMISEGGVNIAVEEIEEIVGSDEDRSEDGDVGDANDFYSHIYENVKMESCEVEPRDGVNLQVLVVKEFKKYPDDTTPEENIRLPEIVEYGMGLSCTGFGKERVFINDNKFRGYEFWTLSNHSKLLSDGNLLICGSGDGALQDFLLLTTQTRTAKEIYKFLRQGEDEQISALFETVERNIRFAEEEAKHNELWETNKETLGIKRLCDIYKNLHNRHEEEADRLLEKDFIIEKLNELVSEEAVAGNIKISYVCSHFSGSYPLNRFLAILIGKYIDNIGRSGGPVFLQGTSVLNIESAVADDRHECKEDADDCFKYPHRVTFAGNCTCENMAGDETKEPEEFRRIFIRYGILRTKAVFGKEPNVPGLQVLPYILP